MASWRNQTAQGPLSSPTMIPQQQQQQQQLQQAPPSLSPIDANSNGPRAKCDQVVFEAIAKAAEIVVGSRCWIENVPGSSSSSRFNLLVPEVQGVRSILHRWKRALHVPLRLDVFYQHPDDRRELLERWCLEYAPKATYSFQHPADPIVQLRQVCKQIVVWLRTLYGWSRMLPAQALRQRHSMGSDNHVGFSIYVVSEGNDDVTGLVTNQGFLSQGQPHSVLTPYGELGWKVFYSPDAVVQQLVPEVPRYSIPQPSIAIPQTRTSSQPIPMAQMNVAQTYNAVHPTTTAAITTTATTATNNYHHHLQGASHEPSVARSAPTKPRSPGYHRSNSDVAGSFPKKAPLMSHDMRRNSDMSILPQHDDASTMHPHQQQQQEEHHLLQSNRQVQQPPSTSRPPTKNLSALSLALLNDRDKANADGETREAAEKRRAALHHAPPQFTANNNSTPPGSSPTLKPSNLATAGEYGYGYNSQIPTMKTAGSNSPALDGRASPAPLSSTPLSSTPTGFLLGTAPTPPPPTVPPLSTLIPPRSSVTPPFVRPAGFVCEPPSQPLPPAATGVQTNGTNEEQQHKRNHQTSLDLLHSSPFQRPSVVPIMDDELRKAFTLNDLMPPNIGGAGLMDPRTRPEEFYYDNAFGHHRGEEEDDMPFAVDTASSHVEKRSSGTSSETTSNLLLSSANGMASFCAAPPKRLALFDSVATAPQTITSESGVPREQTEDQAIMSLADELAEFKTFGASLMMDGRASGTTSSSNTTPITLRP